MLFTHTTLPNAALNNGTVV